MGSTCCTGSRAEGFAVRLADAADGPGGVWRDNDYPGARVDSHVPNYEYSLEAVWRDWTWNERFPGRAELVAYFDHVVDALGLGPDIDVATRIRGATFDPAARRWAVTTDGDRSYRCRYLLACTGFGSQPYVPDLPGLDRFIGECHHTARWPAGGVAMDGQRVGVIGTGASGVQVVQEAAADAAHLTVFQRSPVMAIPMRQQRLEAADQRAAKATYPDVFRRRNTSPTTFFDIARLDVSALDASADEREDVYAEAWRKGGFHFWAGTFNDVLIDERANRTAYDFWRDRTRARIVDPVTAELLAPSEPPYPFGTKRPSLEQTYYECFNQPNVDLVDLRATPIEEITPTGVRTSAGEVHLDVLVLATGFDANTGGLTAIDVRDREGARSPSGGPAGSTPTSGWRCTGSRTCCSSTGRRAPPRSATGRCAPSCKGNGSPGSSARCGTAGTRRSTCGRRPARSGPASSPSSPTRRCSAAPTPGTWAPTCPGKHRQLLNHPSSSMYLDRLRACEAAGYDGFVFER